MGVTVKGMIYDSLDYDPSRVTLRGRTYTKRGWQAKQFEDDLVKVTSYGQLKVVCGEDNRHKNLLRSHVKDALMSAYTSFLQFLLHLGVQDYYNDITITSLTRSAGTTCPFSSRDTVNEKYDDINGIVDSTDNYGHWASRAIDFDIWNMAHDGDLVIANANIEFGLNGAWNKPNPPDDKRKYGYVKTYNGTVSGLQEISPFYQAFCCSMYEVGFSNLNSGAEPWHFRMEE